MKYAKLTKSTTSKILNTNIILEAEAKNTKLKVFIKFNTTDDKCAFLDSPTLYNKASSPCEIKLVVNGKIYKDVFDMVENLKDCIIIGHRNDEEESYTIFK